VTRFARFESRLIPLPVDNIDTDQIIPARFLKTISKDGLGAQLFNDWRYDEEGNPRPDFALNRGEAKGARILLSGANFGCGSSREHAPWALKQFGFLAVISTSFADIFRHNALKNFLLPIVIPVEIHRDLFEIVARNPEACFTVDLAQDSFELPDRRTVKFPIDPFSKRCLLDGIDQLGYVLRLEEAIATYEKKHP